MSTKHRTTLPDPAVNEPGILAKLHNVTRTSSGWTARCPAHDDEKPSLSISVGEDGRVLVHCFTGCSTDEVLKAVDMTFKDLRPERREVAVYPYHDKRGQLVYEVVRYEPKDFRMRRPDGHGGWSWSLRGVQRVVYRLPELQGHGRVFFAEGEKDANALAALGLPSTTTPGGAAAWRDDYADQLAAAGVNEVIVLPDNDGPGREYATTVAAALTARGIRVRVLALPGLAEKADVANWIEAGGTADALKSLVDEAPTLEAWRGTNDVKPVIDTRDGDWGHIFESAYAALVQTNPRHGGPRIFVGPGKLVQVVQRLSDGPAAVEIETEETLRGFLARNVTFLAGGKIARSVTAPPTVLSDLLTRRTWPGLPVLRGVTETPVLSREGEVVTTPRYQPATRLWYAPRPGFEMPPVPGQPTIAEITAATELLQEAFCDFPFADQASRANTIALMMLPFVRESIDGSTPLHLIDATTPASGKGLLADCCSVIATGREAGKGPAPREQEETRKFITSALVAGASMIVMDNIVGYLDSPPLAQALTATVWEDRLLGTNHRVHAVNRAAWVATGNNVTLSNELTRRVVWIRLEPEQERPELRGDFRHSDLLGLIREQRGPLVAACLTLARAWVIKGRPAGSEILGTMLGSFNSWLDVMGGVLTVAGIDGLLGNSHQLQAQVDDELSPWRLFIRLWQDAQLDNLLLEAHASQLLDIAEKAGLDIGEMGISSQLRKLGQALSRIEGRVIGSERIKSRVLNGRKLYRIA